MRCFFAHISELAPKQVSHLRTRVIVFLIEDGQLLDFGQRKAQFLSPLNEDEIFHVRISEQAETTFAARRLLDQSDLLVEPNRVNAEPGPLRNFADLNALRHENGSSLTGTSINTRANSRVKPTSKGGRKGAILDSAHECACIGVGYVCCFKSG